MMIRSSAIKFAGSTFIGLMASTAAMAIDANDWTMRQRGLYLTRAGDCAACHTVDENKPMAGDYALSTPFGTIYTANITPDEETGIGAWSADDFYRAMNEGIRPNGERLYPAFPYTHYTIVTREDSNAIFAYLNSLEPVRQQVREPEFPWPLSMRFALRGWNLLNFENEEFEPDPEKSDAWNRGKYLVEGLGHCAMCHSPKNIIGAVKEGDDAFTGGYAEGWWAPSLTGSTRDGIGHWSDEQLFNFLKHGRNDRTAAFGPMAEVVEVSTSHMTDEDVQAIVEYIRSIPAQETDEAEPMEDDDPAMQLGRTIYEAQCSACHAPDGSGVPGQFAALAGSSLAQSSNPTSLVRIILEGARAAQTERYPTRHVMPAFDWKLDDEEVAAVATYVRNAFGNAASPVSEDFVEDTREDIRKER